MSTRYVVGRDRESERSSPLWRPTWRKGVRFLGGLFGHPHIVKSPHLHGCGVPGVALNYFLEGKMSSYEARARVAAQSRFSSADFLQQIFRRKYYQEVLVRLVVCEGVFGFRIVFSLYYHPDTFSCTMVRGLQQSSVCSPQGLLSPLHTD